MKPFSRLTALALAAVLCSGPAMADEVVHVYNWSDYIAPDTVEKFEEATGIDATYDVFDSNEKLEALMLAGGSGYDVVVPSGTFLERQIGAGAYQKLDKSKIPNWKHLDKALLERVEAYDPGNQYAAPYMWGTTGIGYNIDMVRERLGEDFEVDTWDLIFDPEVASQLADCGISLLDAPSEIFPSARNYLGYDPNGEDEEGLQAALDMLMEVRPYIKYYHSSQYVNDLANGDICVAMGWSGDVYQARDRAAEADQGVRVDYVIPREGAVVWFDLWAIPADAPNPDNAHKWLNFILEPEINADLINYVWYASANATAKELASEEITGDPSVYPDEEVKAKLFPSVTNAQEYLRKQTRAHTRLKTGQ